MLSKGITTRAFSRKLCILANNRQADLIGSKMIREIKAISDEDVDIYGYGGKWMAKEGFQNEFDVDIDQLEDKTFHTYRKSKTNTEANHWKWNPFNLVNLHYMRNANHMLDDMHS